MYKNLVDRFIKYVKIDTRSDETIISIPSTQTQVEFAKVLMKDLKEIGLDEIEYNETNGFVTATLPSNSQKQVPTVGFISHMDTADFNSKNINPQFIENYQGEDIVLNEEKNISSFTCGFSKLKELCRTNADYYRRNDFTWFR